jgi:hypothetical protein
LLSSSPSFPFTLVKFLFIKSWQNSKPSYQAYSLKVMDTSFVSFAVGILSNKHPFTVESRRSTSFATRFIFAKPTHYFLETLYWYLISKSSLFTRIVHFVDSDFLNSLT